MTIVNTHLVDGKYSIKDLIDIQSLREALEDFCLATGFTTAFVEYPSQDILIATGWNDICTKFHRAFPESLKLCRKSNVCLTEQLKELREVNIKPCENGLVDGATPIVIKGKHLASLFVGQVFFEKPDMERFKKQAEIYNYDFGAYSEALGKVPVVNEKQFKNALSFLNKLAVMIAETGISNLELSEKTSKLEEEIRERMQVEKMAKESEAFLQTLIDAIPTPVFYKDRDGKYLGFNRAFETFFGETKERLIDKTVFDINPSGLAELYHAKDQKLFSGGSLQCYESQWKNAQGDLRDFIFNKAIFTDSKGAVKGLIGVLTDITERKQTEETLRESERKYKTLIEAVPDMVWEFDEKEIFTFCSQSYKEILGYDPEELVGKSAYTIMPDSERKQIKDDFGEIKREGRPFRDMLNSNLTKNGELRYLLSSGVPIIDEDGNYKGYRGIDKDITEYKGTEEALKESQERYRNILENVLVGVYQVTLDGKFILANQKMIEMLGYSSDDFKTVGNIAELYARPEERPKVADKIISNGFINEEFEFKRKDGQSIWVKLNTRKARNEEGEIIFEGLMEDVTEFRRMETQLQQSRKMEAIGTLAGGIAHDFNNILAIILGNAELGSEDIPDWNPASRNLKEIRRASIRAKEMVKQLLDFSRKTEGKSKPLNLALAINDCLKMLRTAIPSSVEFNAHVSDGPCTILGDVAQINQIVMNLATNAAHAMSEKGGILEVTIKNIVLLEEKPCFDWVLSPGAYARLKVRDTGTGIDPKIMDRIFEPYFTTKDVGKGTGMGLSVIHGIVKRHGGGIRIESNLGEGTLFEIYFPALEKTVEEEKEPDGEIKKGSERILFVDDEASIVDLNHHRLERLGYQVKSTTKPLEALKWFKADPDQFDVIITDVTMPRMTGDRLTREILAIRPQMAVIICTGYSERMSEKDAEVLGARKYIEKPISKRNLAAALREVLEEK